MRRAQAIAPIASLQPRYSLLHREIEPEILPFVAQENIGVIAYSPMASGLLTGAMTRERIAGLPADDWRRDHDGPPTIRAIHGLEGRARTVTLRWRHWGTGS
jgi:aryl-alcohol dehydrogenase-like predicted oxidoreductase